MRPHRNEDAESFRIRLDERADYLCEARPTAVNLSWAVRRIQTVATDAAEENVQAAWDAMLAEAHRMAREDAETCRKIGEHGADLVPEGGKVITHCNAGALATVAYGTALSVLYVAHERGRRFQVFADETRPLLQGARLTAFELHAAGLNVTVLCDNAAGALMKTRGAQLAIVGADRIAANGDVANKIGTYGLAVLAQRHGVPFYVAAPVSTFDLSLASGEAIPIEQRSEDEVRGGFGQDVVPPGVPCYNPAFDVTPAELVTGIITERGIVKPVTEEHIQAVCS
jgi:methylthioribose-1-phosphate isomerase